MKDKIKIFSLLLALSTITFSAEVDKYNSELIVSGSGVKERVDYTIYSKELETEDEKKEEMILNGTNNGKKNVKHAVYADKGATVHNIGKILSYDEKINTNLGGFLINGIVNPLKRDDTLIALRGANDPKIRTTFINDGLVNMGSMFQRIDVIDIIGVIPTGIYYAQYNKNTIDAENTDIINNGTITNNRDKIEYWKDLNIGILNGFIVDYTKNAVNISYGSLTNTGNIEYNRDEKFTLTNGVSVDLLQIGVDYTREKSAVKSSGSEIKNSGTIFVGGDILTDGKYSGVGVAALGADLKGAHNKYGINAFGGKVINEGLVEVERDFKKALDKNNNILDLYLIYENILKLGLLSFTNLAETSIGVGMNGGEFYNNGGTISVGVNESKLATQLRKGAAIAVAGDNEARIYFNTEDTPEKKPILNATDKNGNPIEVKSTINLEGKNVYATWLRDNSIATFKGTTEINFIVPDGLSEKAVEEYLKDRNRHIFYTDNSSKVIIEGKVIANGDISISPYKIDNKEEHVDHVIISPDYKEIKDSNGNIIGFDKKEVALISKGKLELGGDIKVSMDNFIGMSDEILNKYATDEYIKADGGIVGNGNLVSSSYLFDIKTDKTNNSISLTDINRKNFNTIVENKELGKILEDSYEGVSGEKLDFYKYISLGDSYESFSERLNEITGIDNITTLEAQVVDITKDLNRQYKGFIKNNKEEGVVFSYLNSKSEIGEQGKYSGFERESNGFMSGYNKYVLDNLRVGAGLSYMKSSIDYTDESSNKIETWNARAYSDYKIKDINLLSDISLGYNQSENKRFVGGNLHDGDVNIYTLGINNSLYKNYNITDRFSINPSINLDFTYYYQDDYKENDGKFSVNADKTDGYYGTLGTTVDLKYDIFTSGNSKVSLVGGMEYSYDILSSTEDIKLENITGKFSEEKRELDKDSLVYKVGVEYNYNNDYSVGLEYSKEIINDVDNEKIGLNFVYKF